MSLFDDDLAEDMKDPEFRREYIANTLRINMLHQLGRCGMDGGGSVGVDSNTGYDGDATIDCYQLADAVLRAIDSA
ncbi:hypothetical protein ACFO5K_04175 [Nocardia halotolerans]|uniref:Uncharacterized protein n=1 Tax=Nocardia halotolerans TaxID=1755878 RepID=A0ABV8VBM3_9NOCA